MKLAKAKTKKRRHNLSGIKKYGHMHINPSLKPCEQLKKAEEILNRTIDFKELYQ